MTHPQEKLAARLIALADAAEITEDGDRVPGDDPTAECVFVDIRPAEFDSLIREAATLLSEHGGGGEAGKPKWWLWREQGFPGDFTLSLPYGDSAYAVAVSTAEHRNEVWKAHFNANTESGFDEDSQPPECDPVQDLGTFPAKEQAQHACWKHYAEWAGVPTTPPPAPAAEQPSINPAPADSKLIGEPEGKGAERWITQTTFYDPAEPDACAGNCTEAAVASILGIPLNDVPCWAGMKATEFWDAVEEFFASRGFVMLMQSGNYVPECLYLASGQSPRGCSHMVVMRNGKLVHDPHPSRAGIDPVEHVWLIVPLDPSAHPTPAAPVGVEGDAEAALRIVNTAIEVCDELSRPAMAEDLESVREFIKQRALTPPAAPREE